MKSNAKVVILLMVLFVFGSQAFGQVERIDFSTLPDGTPVTDGMLITDAYAAWGVTFELIQGLGGPPSPDAGPRIAEVGWPRTAFRGPSRSVPACGVNRRSVHDVPGEGTDVGCFFLTDDGHHNTNAFGLRINYLTPVNRAYGELIDLDAEEYWVVTAFDAEGNEIARQEFVDDDPGTDPEENGMVTAWLFDLDELISAIEFVPGTYSPHPFGLAFDNFSPSSIPFYPVCDAGGPYEIEVGEPVQFSAAGSSDSDGSIVSYAWTFGDGGTASGISPVHTFQEPGDFSVELCVIDNDGNETCCQSGVLVPVQETSWDALKACYR